MIRRLLRLSDDKPRTLRYLLLLGASAVVRAATVLALVPLLTRLFSQRPADALGWIGSLAALVALGWIVDHRLYRAGFDIGFGILRTVEARVLDRLERVPLGWLDADRRGDAQRALTSAGQEICQGIGYLVTPAVNAMVTPLLIGVGLLAIAWPLGVAAIGAVPLLALALAASGRLLRHSDAAYARASDDVASRIVELAQHQAALRAADRATGHGTALGSALLRQRRAALRLLGFGIPGTVLFGVVSQLALVALVATAVGLYLSGAVTGPALLALIVVAVRFLEPFTTLGDLSGAVQALRGTVDRVFAILDAPGLPVIDGAGVEDPAAAVLAFDRVRFGYDDEAVIHEVSFTVETGTTTAVVGPSGSGKSTLLALAARLHDVTGGAIRFRGRDIRGYPTAELAARFAIVHQNVYLFDGTLGDNIRLGNRRATDAELEQAASRAGLDETLRRLPHGWDTRVGESGATLSGGERQRVAIARALVKAAPLLLLDEVTSALDTGNERGVIDALAATSSQRATVIVAHRLDTIIGAYRIVFLDDGHIVESGSPAELIAAGGRFAEYWRQRHEATGWHLVPSG